MLERIFYHNLHQKLYKPINILKKLIKNSPYLDLFLRFTFGARPLIDKDQWTLDQKWILRVYLVPMKLIQIWNLIIFILWSKTILLKDWAIKNLNPSKILIFITTINKWVINSKIKRLVDNKNPKGLNFGQCWNCHTILNKCLRALLWHFQHRTLRVI